MLYIESWSVVEVITNIEQSKDVHGIFEVIGEMWDERLMKSVGSTSLARDGDVDEWKSARTQ